MRSDTQLLKGTVRLLILRLLDGEPMYGYQMIQHLKECSEGYFQLGEGALYPLLHEMEGQRFLKARWSSGEGGRGRRYYHLTAKGRKELARRLETWQGFTKAVDLVLEASHV
jgi:PadR family transcriptional regulator PadR